MAPRPLGPHSSRTAAPDRLRHRCTGSGQPPRRTNAGPVRRGAFEEDYNHARHSQAEWEPTSQWPRAASWRWSFLPWFEQWFVPGPTGGAWGQAAAASGEEFEQRGAPVRSAHCFRVSPDPGESWSTAMGSGRRHRQVQRRMLQGKIKSISRYDAPQERLRRAGEGFSPAVSHT